MPQDLEREKRGKMTKTPYITVRWLDHKDHPKSWVEANEHEPPAHLESKGWLIFEDEFTIQLAGDRPLDKGDNTYGRVGIILKSAIYYRSDQRPKVPEQSENTNDRQPDSQS